MRRTLTNLCCPIPLVVCDKVIRQNTCRLFDFNMKQNVLGVVVTALVLDDRNIWSTSDWAPLTMCWFDFYKQWESFESSEVPLDDTLKLSLIPKTYCFCEPS